MKKCVATFHSWAIMKYLHYVNECLLLECMGHHSRAIFYYLGAWLVGGGDPVSLQHLNLACQRASQNEFRSILSQWQRIGLQQYLGEFWFRTAACEICVLGRIPYSKIQSSHSPAQGVVIEKRRWELCVPGYSSKYRIETLHKVEYMLILSHHFLYSKV